MRWALQPGGAGLAAMLLAVFDEIQHPKSEVPATHNVVLSAARFLSEQIESAPSRGALLMRDELAELLKRHAARIKARLSEQAERIAQLTKRRGGS